MSKSIIALDATILTNLMSCPRYVDYKFNQQNVHVSGPGNSLECGSLVHFILEYYNKSLIAGKSRTEAIQIAFAAGHEYREPYDESNLYLKDENHKGLVNTPEESDKKYIGWSYVFKTMEEYFDYWNSDSWTILASEETRKEIIYEDDDLVVLWKAKFDQIVDMSSGIMSIDHKTMRQRRDSLSLNNQFMGQCVLLKTRNILINKIGFQTSLKPQDKFIRAIMSYSTDRLAEFVNDVVPYYARMYAAYAESEYWPPNFNQCEGKYGRCEFVPICEHDRGTRDEALKINFVKGKKWDV